MTNEVELCLRDNAADEGESRPAGRRITFVPPLSVTFTVDEESETVWVLHVRVFRRRSK